MHVCGHWYGEQCCRRKFSFLSHGKALFHFPSAKNGSFCEVTTKMPFQNATVPFSKNTRPPYMDYLPTGTSQTFSSIPGKKDKCLPNREEVGPVCTTGT